MAAGDVLEKLHELKFFDPTDTKSEVIPKNIKKEIQNKMGTVSDQDIQDGWKLFRSDIPRDSQ